jgi:hypothetical protein
MLACAFTFALCGVPGAAPASQDTSAAPGAGETRAARHARALRAARAARAASTPRTDAAALGRPPAPGEYAPAPPADPAVYRCGSSYSAQPCSAAPPIDVDDSRTASQRRQAQDVAARDRRLADWLQAQRHEREAAASAPQKARDDAKPCQPTSTLGCPRPKKAFQTAPHHKPKAAPPTTSPSPAGG